MKVNRNIKLITPAGFVKIGHVAILCRGWTIVRAKQKFAEVVTRLTPIDRLIGAQEFADLTDSTIEYHGKKVMPKKAKPAAKEKKEPLSLI